MHPNEIHKKALLAMVMLCALLVAVGCGASDTASLTPVEQAPCSVGSSDECAPRDIGAYALFRVHLSTPSFAHPASYGDVEQVLEEGLDLLGMSPTHIAVRATAQPKSIRCAWRGVAQTIGQREAAIRFWLGLDSGNAIPSQTEIRRDVQTYINQISVPYQVIWLENFEVLLRGGFSTEYQFMTCYFDYLIHEYLLGSGTVATTLTVAYDLWGESRSYDLYRRAHALGEFGSDQVMSEGQYKGHLGKMLQDTEAALADIIGGRESVVFLAPMGAHNAIAVEAWQAVEQWDLQTRDGTVYAVRYGVPEGDAEHSQTLANLKSRITTAATTDKFAGKRIANVSGLNTYYRDIGAYGDITPDDGKSDTFTPAQPPAKLTCANGTAVASPNVNRGLVHDCEALLAAKDTLRGTASLNWSASTAITGWAGVTVSGTPKRVTQVRLSNKGLSGTLPAALGELSALTALDLSRNSLTGSIPSELGLLHNLTELRLSENTLTGCIPVALKDVATNDLASLDLLYCAPPAPGSLSAGTATASAVPLTWGALSNASKYRVEYVSYHRRLSRVDGRRWTGWEGQRRVRAASAALRAGARCSAQHDEGGGRAPHDNGARLVV